LAPEIWLTFNSDWTYWIGVKDDSLGFCDPGPNCSYGGEFSATATPSSSGPDLGQFSLDPGTVGEVTLNYSIRSIGFNVALLMTVTGNIDGNPITLGFSSWNWVFGAVRTPRHVPKEGAASVTPGLGS